MPDQVDLAALAAALDVDIDLGLLEHALTHRSYAYEHRGVPNNERLEFLGDSVLGLVVTDTLYHRHPNLPESDLAKYRASVVNARSLAEAGRSLGLGKYLLLGRGEQVTGGREKASILSDCVEALIGAVFVGNGLEDAAALVHRLLDDRMDQAAQLGAGLDWKTSLQELGARTGKGVPAYSVVASGPDHDRRFVATVTVGSDIVGEGHGVSKKQAEQEAAAAAYAQLRAFAESAVNMPGGPVDADPGNGSRADGGRGSGNEAGRKGSSRQAQPDGAPGQAGAARR